jgi:hypothetical protein
MCPECIDIMEALAEENAILKKRIELLSAGLDVVKTKHEAQMRELWHHFNNTVSLVADIVNPLLPANAEPKRFIDGKLMSKSDADLKELGGKAFKMPRKNIAKPVPDTV